MRTTRRIRGLYMRKTRLKRAVRESVRASFLGLAIAGMGLCCVLMPIPAARFLEVRRLSERFDSIPLRPERRKRQRRPNQPLRRIPALF